MENDKEQAQPSQTPPPIKSKARTRAGWRAWVPARVPAWVSTLTPTRWHWLSLLCGPSSYPLLVSVFAVMIAKYAVMARLGSADTGIMTWVGLIVSDLSLHFGLIALFSVGEARSRRLLFATLPIALLVTSLATINALYLQVSGEQLSWEALTIGLEQSTEVFGILSEEGILSFGRVVGFLLIVALPIIAWRALARFNTESSVALQQGRAKAAVWVALPALLVSLVGTDSDFIPLRVLQGNATLSTYADWVSSTDDDAPQLGFQAYDPVLLSSAQQTSAMAQKSDQANVLFVVLESVRWDHTSLYNTNSSVQTPNLEALAQRGTLVSQARAVMPHTSKSLFSMLCGRLPMMQRRNHEANANVPIQCLPSLLHDVGYETVFMQTALGAFEDRPRLIERLGYREFKGWEDIQGEPSGYLSSDDESLVPAVENWLANRQSERPFFMTLLTSATHHPYRLVGKAKERVERSGAPVSSDRERYSRLIEAQDFMIGDILSHLKSQGLLESTVVVVVGDHGEGFGDKGVRQHDNNFYEEGLHVPLVIAGPNVPKQRVDKNVSLVDLTPTLMEILGFQLEEYVATRLPGASIYSEGNQSARRTFACYFDGYCYGYVQGETKVILTKGMSEPIYFDLSIDPDELKAVSATDAMQTGIGEIMGLVQQHYSEAGILRVPLIKSFGDWICPPRRHCHHPRSPKTFFFSNP